MCFAFTLVTVTAAQHPVRGVPLTAGAVPSPLQVLLHFRHLQNDAATSAHGAGLLWGEFLHTNPQASPFPTEAPTAAGGRDPKDSPPGLGAKASPVP